MRKLTFAHNEFYHLHNRGVSDIKLFQDEADFARFLFLILHFQSPTAIHNISTTTNSFLRHHRFGISREKATKLETDRSVELISFSLLPQELNLLVRNIEEQYISVYMHRVLMAYGKYYNAKYNRSGHVFDGPFRAKRIKGNEELLATSSYIHNRPKTVPDYAQNNDTYPWSSYRDYVGENRFPGLLYPKVILSQFKTPASYNHFIQTSGDKELEPLADY